MTNQVIFWTQIASVLAYIISVFFLYRLLVKQKDAVIESKNAAIELLKEQLGLAKQSSPDILIERLSKRVEILKDELKALSQDNDAKKEEILAKEKEIKDAEERLGIFNVILEDANRMIESEVDKQIRKKRCPYCKSKVADYSPSIPTEFNDIRKQKIRFDIEYECGLKTVGGKEITKCGRS